MAEQRVERRLAAVLAADVAGYSRLMGADEEGTLARLNAHRREFLEPTVAEHHGRIVKRTGDGILIEFGSAVDAARCAIKVQRGMTQRSADVSADQRIEIRIGIHVGDIIIEEGDIFGDGVNIAARLEGIAEPGGIFLSYAAYEQVRDRLKESFVDLGEYNLKNIARPVRVYRLDLTPKAKIASKAPQPMSAPSDTPSIAVLAFNNMSGDPEQEYFSDGISEDIITDLSKLSELHVIARNSTFTYKGKAVDVKQIGRELGVRYVLEGSVRKAANRVRVTSQLIDSTSGAHIWADRFDRDLIDIFAVQDGITLEIISALKVKLTPEKRDRLARKVTIDEEAYDLFLRGREQAWLLTKSSNVEARNLLGCAIKNDPGFAAAHALIAYTHAVDYANGRGDNPERSLQTSLEIAGRAVQLDDEDAEAHVDFAVALAWHREHDRALAEARRSIALAPNFARGHLIAARILTVSGDAVAAINAIEASMRFDPLYRDITLHYLAEARVSLGQFDAAIAALKQRLDRNPNAQTSLALLAKCYGHLGRIAEAQAAWAEVMRIAPNFSIEWQRRVLPYQNPSDFERRVEGLRKANISA
jgi:TolB-like protein/class 3 adenylate cyclase